MLLADAVYVDTSAILALLISSDTAYARARRSFDKLAAEQAPLITSSYVLVETYALLGRRVGLAAVRQFREAMAPLIETVWVDQRLHEQGLDMLLQRGRRRLSLVDAVSLVIIRDRSLKRAFAYDDDFAKAGLEMV
jgi:predicted nucleic acid-binding protein